MGQPNFFFDEMLNKNATEHTYMMNKFNEAFTNGCNVTATQHHAMCLGFNDSPTCDLTYLFRQPPKHASEGRKCSEVSCDASIGAPFTVHCAHWCKETFIVKVGAF